MKCSQCGKELSPTARFCTDCGAEVLQDKPNFSENSVTSYSGNIINRRKEKYKIIIIVCTIALAGIIGIGVKNGNSQKSDEQKESDSYISGNMEEYAEDEGNIKADEKDEALVSSDYVLPESSSSYLSKSDLEGLTSAQCRLARNEIYARHGRMFQDEALQVYFTSRDWYTPIIYPDDFEESMLNEYEVANRDLIIEYEQEQGYR